MHLLKKSAGAKAFAATSYRLGVKTLRNKNQKGFTLIELLVVIAIIGLLASVVLLALNSARAKSRDAKRIADVRQLASALELFFNDASAYPTAAGYSGTTGEFGYNGNLWANGGAYKLTPTYIGIIPQAPGPQDGTCTAANNKYIYQVDNTGSTYTLTFCLGGVTGGYSAGTHNLTPAGIQ